MKRIGLALLVLTNACGPTATVSDNVPEDVKQALEALPRAEIVSFANDGLPNAIRGDLGRADNLRDTEAALTPAIEAIGPVFRVAGNDLRLRKAALDDLGFTHARYQQTKNGLDVVGGDLLVHLDVDCAIFAAAGGARDGVDLDAVPNVDAEIATAEAMATALPGSYVFGTPRLVYVVDSNETLFLAWELLQEGAAGAQPVKDLVYINAKTGELIERHTQIRVARSRRVYSANHGTSLPGTLKISEGGASVSDASVMAAYNNTGITYDCYKALFARDSYDNAGAAIKSSVHYSNSYANAYWDGSQMVFGDGDGAELGDLARSFDVTAHEYTHAVNSATANFVYQNEPGALDEGWADIMAATCEAWSDGAISASTWMIGEDVWTPGTAGDALRYMANPTADDYSRDYYPSRLTGSDDYGGVHGNSGIANLAFKLLVTGGSHPRGVTSTVVPALGLEKSAKIFYRASSYYLSSSSNFQAARTATVQAATDLYGATEAAAVTACWDAVGVPGGTSSSGGAAAEALTPGSAKSITGAKASSRLFTLAVPAGATNLQVKLSGGSGDPDLYVRHNAAPTTSTSDAKSEASGTTEAVTIAAPSSGTYQILVYAYAAYSGVSLVATYTTGSAGGGSSGGGSSTSTVLTKGTAVTGLTAAKGAQLAFTFVVPAGASNLTFSMSGGSGDGDLYVRFGAAPTTSTYDYRPYKDGNAESVAATAATAGTWHVMISAYAAFSGVSLVANYSTGSSGGGSTSGNVLSDGAAVTLAGAASSSVTYAFVVPAGKTNVSFTLSGGTGDADIYVRYGAAPTTSTYDHRPYLEGNNESVSATATAGTWYVMVRGYTAFSGVSLVAHAS